MSDAKFKMVVEPELVRKRGRDIVKWSWAVYEFNEERGYWYGAYHVANNRWTLDGRGEYDGGIEKNRFKAELKARTLIAKFQAEDSDKDYRNTVAASDRLVVKF